jgi:ABC-type multidrug transport system fused ATPase/permease subunit
LLRHLTLPPAPCPLLLQNLSASLQPREKIGIAGRTGSGKSSLMVTLFRMASLETGAILIDGVDISKLPLVSLRSRLGIVPQGLFALLLLSHLLLLLLLPRW